MSPLQALLLFPLLAFAAPLPAEEETSPQALCRLAAASEAEGEYPAALEYLRRTAQQQQGDPAAGLEARKDVCALIRRHPEALPLGEPLVRVGGNVQPPQRLHTPEPVLPEGKSFFGLVILRMVIDREGCTRDVEVLKAPGADVGAAVGAAAKEWVFEPAQLNGKAVDIYYNVTFRYHPGR